jgi:hypothetical protein
VQDLAKYARLLEEELAKYKPKEKSAEEVEDAADSLRGVITRGMIKLMKVRDVSVADGVGADAFVVDTLVQDAEREALV